MRVLRAIMAASLATLPAAAQEESALVEPNPFVEEVREGAEISGAALVGLLRHGAPWPRTPQPRPRAFRVELPPDVTTGKICVRILTSDGLYEASAEYDLGEKGPDAAFAYPTQHGARLDALEPGALAIRTTAGSCEVPPDPGAETYVTVWRNPDSRKGPASVVLLVKSFGADEVFLLPPGSGPARCRALDAGGVSAAEHACDLPDALSGRVTLELFSLTDGISSRPIAMPVWLKGR